MEQVLSVLADKLVDEINELKSQINYKESMLWVYCNHPGLSIKERFFLWEENITKRDFNHPLYFGIGDMEFNEPTPKEILGFREHCCSFLNDGDELSYEDLLTYVIEQHLQAMDQEDFDDTTIDKLRNTDLLDNVMEFIIIENLGSWVHG